MQSEQESILALDVSAETPRQWQFSIRAVLGLMLGMSLLLAFFHWWRWDGVHLFCMLSMLTLIVAGITFQNYDLIVYGTLTLLLLWIPGIIFMILIVCLLYFFTCGLMLLGERVDKCVRNRK